MTTDKNKEEVAEKTNNEAALQQTNPSNESTESEEASLKDAPACDLAWIDGEFVLECDSEEDGMMALDLLQRARITLGRGTEKESKED